MCTVHTDITKAEHLIFFCLQCIVQASEVIISILQCTYVVKSHVTYTVHTDSTKAEHLIMLFAVYSPSR